MIKASDGKVKNAQSKTQHPSLFIGFLPPRSQRHIRLIRSLPDSIAFFCVLLGDLCSTHALPAKLPQRTTTPLNLQKNKFQPAQKSQPIQLQTCESQ